MKILKHYLLGLAGLLSFSIANAQSVDQVIAKYVDAVGGAGKLGKVTSLYEETTVSIMGNESNAIVNILNGKGYKNEMEFNGQKIVQCYTDKSGWMINPMAGATDATAMPDEQYKGGKDQIDIGGPLFNYSSKGNKVELAGKEKVGNSNAYKIKVVTADNVETAYYIDSVSNFLVKVVRKANVNGQDMDISISYSDFKKTDYGITVPYAVEINYGDQFSFTSAVKKVEFDKAIDSKIFDMPK